MKLLFVICSRKQTKNIIKMLNDNKVSYRVSLYGKGTADNEMLSYLGLAADEKEVVISLVEKELTPQIIKEFEETSQFKNHGAVAFAVPLDAINRSTLEFIQQ